METNWGTVLIVAMVLVTWFFIFKEAIDGVSREAEEHENKDNE